MFAFVGFIAGENNIHFPWATTLSGTTYDSIAAAGGAPAQWDAVPTLGKLHSYCQANRDALVFYLHTKGASSMGITEKLLFASGWPAETPAKAIETIYSVNGFSHGTQLPSIPRPQLRSIVERDLPTVLGMPIAPTASSEKAAESTSEVTPLQDEA